MVRKYTLIVVIAMLMVSIIIMPQAIGKKDTAKDVKISKSLAEKLDDGESVKVIIVIGDSKDSKDESKDKSKNARIASRGNEVSIQAISDSLDGFEKDRDLEIISGFSGELTPEGLEELESLQENGVNVQIFEDKDLHIHSALIVGVAAVKGNDTHVMLGLRGSGIRIGFIDTGIDYTHPDLGGCYGNNTNTSCRVFGGYDFYNDDNDPIDDHNHGTHVAGIAGANGNSTGVNMTGVAPNSTLYALKACNSGGTCPTSAVIDAIDWAVNASLDIISMSLGSYASDTDEGNTGKDAFSLAVDEAINQGIVIVVSAGNDGPGVSTINIPGSSENAITVGAVRDANTATTSDDVIWEESSRGPGAFGRMDPELVAPGYQIESTITGASRADLTGTSMAVPFVSGAAALLLERYPELTPSQVRAMLIQSTTNISGKTFEKGTGELNILNAIESNVRAEVSYINPYQIYSTSDRWEFVVNPLAYSTANITIVNLNNHNISFNINFETFMNMENNITINTSQFRTYTSVNVTNNSNYTFQINFTMNNLSAAYASTYGGLMILSGNGSNGTVNLKTIRIPIALTVPIIDHVNTNKTMIHDYDGSGSFTNPRPSHEDVYFYAYYSSNPINFSARINWSDSSDELWLFLYNSTGDYMSKSNDGSANNQLVQTINSGTFKWVRIDGYEFDAPIGFTLNLTNPSNRAPVLINTTPVNGSINSSSALLVYSPNNITLNISYYDPENDAVNISINDSSYIFISNSSIGQNKSIIYSKPYNSSTSQNTSIIISLRDIYDTNASTTLSVLYLPPIILNSYTSNSSELYIDSAGSIEFTVDAAEISGNPLFYRWIINGTLNSTIQNFTFDASNFTGNKFALSVLITNSNTSNQTNQTIRWVVNIDDGAPTLNVSSPIATIYNDSIININYTSSDNAGVDGCWYNINGTSNITNTTLDLCANATIYLPSGNYTLNIYSNDSINNIASVTRGFFIADNTTPIISNASPSGSQGSVSSVILQVQTHENSSCRYDSSDVNYTNMTSSFDDFTTIHNSTYAVSAGSHLLFVRCMDMSNNTNNESANISFTVSASGGGGGGSGGSGSGSGGSGGSSGGGVGSSNTASRTVNIINGHIKVNFTNSNIPVSNVEINSTDNADGNISNVTLRLTRLTRVDNNYSQNVSAYINFSTQNIPENEGLEVRMYFSVSHQWINLSNITENDIVLLKYNPENDTWENLTTQFIREDNLSAYYYALAKGDGIYAISYINDTGGDGKVIITPEIEQNETLNKTNEVVIHSEDSGLSGSRKNLSGGQLTEILEYQMKWMAIAIGALIVVFCLSLFGIHKYSVKKYESDLILSTEKTERNLGVPKDGIYRGNNPNEENEYLRRRK